MSSTGKAHSVLEVAVGMMALSLLCAGVSEACLCNNYKTFVEMYCSADFVIRATPITSAFDPPGSSEYSAMQRVYNVSVAQVFKAPPSLEREEQWTIYTSPNEVMCGAVLDENTEYLLTGRVFGDVAVMNNCMSWIMPWSQLLPWEKKGVRRNYKLYCPGPTVTEADFE